MCGQIYILIIISWFIDFLIKKTFSVDSNIGEMLHVQPGVLKLRVSPLLDHDCKIHDGQ